MKQLNTKGFEVAIVTGDRTPKCPEIRHALDIRGEAARHGTVTVQRWPGQTVWASTVGQSCRIGYILEVPPKCEVIEALDAPNRLQERGWPGAISRLRQAYERSVGDTERVRTDTPIS